MNRITALVSKFGRLSLIEKQLFLMWSKLSTKWFGSVQPNTPIAVARDENGEPLVFAPCRMALIYGDLAMSRDLATHEMGQAGLAVENAVDEYAMLNGVDRVFIVTTAQSPELDKFLPNCRELRNVRIWEKEIPTLAHTIPMMSEPSISRYLN